MAGEDNAHDLCVIVDFGNNKSVQHSAHKFNNKNLKDAFDEYRPLKAVMVYRTKYVFCDNVWSCCARVSVIMLCSAQCWTTCKFIRCLADLMRTMLCSKGLLVYSLTIEKVLGALLMVNHQCICFVFVVDVVDV